MKRMIIISILSICCLAFAFSRIYFRSHFFTLGYKVAKLRDKKNQLTHEQAHLMIELSDLSSRENLSSLISHPLVTDRGHMAQR